MATLGELLPIVLPVLVGLALIGLASLVARSGLHVLHNRFYSALYFLSGIKSVSEGLLADYKGSAVAARFHASSPLFPGELAWVHISETCGLAMLPLVFLFVMSFPAPRPWLMRHPWLAVVAFLPSAALAGLLFGTPYAARLDPTDPRAALVFEYAGVGFSILSSVVTFAALLVIVGASRRGSDRIQRQQAGYVAMGLLPSFVATWVLTMLLMGYLMGSVEVAALQGGIHYIGQYLSPIFELLAAGLVAFAILKYNILGIDPKFRVGVKSFLASFIFVAVFLVTQFIENVVLQGQLFSFAGDYGSFMLSGIAGIVLFKPIEKVSNKVSTRLLPEKDDSVARSLEVYRAQCTYILGDAKVTEREMAFLRNLRQQLGLNDAQARAVEESVERTLKVDAPETGASSGTARSFVAAASAEMAETPFEVQLSGRHHPPPQGGRVAVRAAPAAKPSPPSRPMAPVVVAARATKAQPPASVPAPAARKAAAPPAKAAAQAPATAAKPAAGKGPAPAPAKAGGKAPAKQGAKAPRAPAKVSVAKRPR